MIYMAVPQEQQLLSLQGDSQKTLHTECKTDELAPSKKPEPAKSALFCPTMEG